MDFKIIAVDFDGTLCENCYPDIGAPKAPILKYVLSEQKKGAKIILWTCRIGEHLNAAVRWCNAFGLYFDAVNENLEECIELFGGDTRKVFAHEYIDDRNSQRIFIHYDETFKPGLESAT